MAGKTEYKEHRQHSIENILLCCLMGVVALLFTAAVLFIGMTLGLQKGKSLQSSSQCSCECQVLDNNTSGTNN